MWKLLLIPVLLYAALLILIFAFQARLVFPAGAVGGAGPLPAGAERLSFESDGGDRLHGIHIRPAVRPSGTLILGFGGNAWNAEAAAAYLHGLFPEADVVAFHYRGYRPSTGSPSAAALLEDAPRAYDLAVRRLRPARTVAVGFSVGSGVAASLAPRRPIAGLILVTPFDSMRKVAAGHYPWLPVRWLFRHEMKPAQWLRESQVPVAIIAGERDTLIPPPRTEGLRRSTGRLVYDKVIAGAGHNDIYDRPEFRAAMREALGRTGG
ncbi:MAG TPA: alpha/beta fold hydrolase [Allosphingosinicella sp.]|nr:alpha/beta fold hydrolase [Allosphingosinicella sp.]